jgi:hypothetical protein
MKKKYSKFVIYIFTWIALFIGNVVSGQNFSDNASNYSGSWTTGSNQGSGFGTWSLSTGANIGSFIGNPASNGMGTSGIGTTAFGMFATQSGYFNAYRSINNGIQVGDTFSFYWAMNWDANGGSKGFDLRSGGTTIFNVNNGGSATITTTDGNANTSYGTTPMLVTITRTSASAYSFSMTSRSGGATYTTTIINSATIDGFNFYIGNQNSGSGERNMFVNGFSITKPITLADGNWNETAIWLNNTIPPTDASVTINHNISLNTDVSLRSILINNGKTLTASDSTPRTLTISNGGSLTNNGTFTAGNGTVAFAGSATVSGTITFNNATLAGGVNFGTGSIISGTLTINPGGFVSTNAPTYNSGATLRYNTNGPYGRGTEWSAISGNGYPHHVQISGNTTFNVNNGANVARQMGGNLTVDSGSTLSLEGMTIASPSEIGLTVVGNVINNGSITLASSTERLKCVNYTNNANALTTLSTNIGGDLELTGNFIDNAPFNSNNRAVFFTGSGVQDVSGSGTFDIDYIVSNKPSGSIRMLTNLLVEGPNGGNAITLTNATDILDLNDNTLILGKANVASVFTGSGFIRGGSTSSISIQGTGALGTIRFDQSVPGTSNVLNNLTINRTSGSVSVIIGNALNIIGVITVTAGTLESGGNITLKSNANGTAQVAAIGSGGSITGNVTVERYIPSGKRAFRLLSPAVTTTNFISNNWQGQTHITGGASGGFDATETNNPSMFTYNNQAAQGVSGWTPIANTDATNLTAGVGYRVLIRGDRNVNLTVPSANGMNAAITLSATGTLKTGTVPLSLSSTPSINNTTNSVTNGFSLVGNPYQSAVDWHLVTRTGIEDTYYAWDPNMGTGAARGNYVPYNVLTGNTFGGQVGQFIQPGQAFFVKNTGPGAGSLTFEEADKATTSANVFRTNNQTESTNFATLSTALYDPNELAIGGYPIDATKAVFGSDYTNELGLGDATKLEAAGENIAWFRNNTKLAIDAAAPVTTSDELAMKTLRLGANKNYTFKIQTTNFDNALTPYLVDTFLNTQTEIATSQAFLASFATTSNQASYSEDRFKIVFQTSALSADDFVKNIKLYPNPAKAGGSFYVDGITEATVSVYNVVGQNIPVTVMSQGNAVQVTPTAALSQGVYLVTVTTAGKTTQVKWIVE